nr:MAG TPA: hypothetical protein [Caudoviricetes sp.]DAY26716.1 MAG TPA: hypothetical protein [Caudoviricetes sp.]
MARKSIIHKHIRHTPSLIGRVFLLPETSSRLKNL